MLEENHKKLDTFKNENTFRTFITNIQTLWNKVLSPVQFLDIPRIESMLKSSDGS